MKRFLCIILSLALIFSIAGCKPKTENTADTQGLSKSDEKYTGQLPIVEKPVTLKYLLSEGNATTTAVPSNDLPVIKAYEKFTNVHIEWEVLPSATYADVITARVSAGVDLPDMINGINYNLASKVGPDGIIRDLTPLMEKYAPRMTKYYNAPENRLLHYTRLAPDGKIYVVNSISVPSCLVQGIVVNKLWLEKLGLNIPQTVDEFTNMLVAFRDRDPNGNGTKDEIPLTSSKDILKLLGIPFGVNVQYDGNYIVDSSGKITDIRTTSNYKDYLTYLNKLYSEGLLDKDYLNYTDTKLYEKVKKDTLGAASTWRAWAVNLSSMSPLSNNDPNKEVYIPIANLKDKNGKITEYKRYFMNPGGTAITKECKNPDIAMKWMDFVLFSQEAQDLYIYGIEGLTYKVENGKKVRLTPPAGKTYDQVLVEAGGRQPAHPYIQTTESRRELFPEWIFKYDDSFQKYFIDPFPGSFMPMLPEEKMEVDQYSTDVNTYYTEMTAKFITGQEPLSKFDEFAKTFIKIGADKIAAVNQKRYDRYLQMAGKK